MNDNPSSPDRSPDRNFDNNRDLDGAFTRPNKRLKLVVLLAGLAVVAYVGGNGMKNAWVMQRKVQCSKQMQSIASSLSTYEYAFDQSQGPPIAFLQKLGCDDRRLICPGHAGSNSNYVVVGPVTRKPGDETRVAMYEPLSNHDGTGANVLFANGHAQFVEPKEYRELISRVSAND